ncbi:MAG: hypothetical protein WBA28_06790 [Microbacteriaceae bacterium]
MSETTPTPENEQPVAPEIAEAVTDAEQDAVLASVSESASPEIATPEIVSRETHEVQIRRAPKFSVFLVLGMIVGLTIATILTYSYPEVLGKTTWTQVFGFMFLPAVAIGGALGSVLALIVDRRSRAAKRIKHASAEHVEIRED